MNQLETIANLLNGESVDYWVDSGTLLALERDGELFEHDHDLDFGVWESEREAIDDLISKTQGYRLQKRYFKGYCHKYLLLPKKGQPRSIDIQFFRESNGYGWLPLTKTKDYNQFLPNWLAEALSKLSTVYAKTKSGDIHIDRGIKSYFVELLTLVIPVRYIKKTTMDNRFDVQVPRYTEEYLSYRYGEWQKEVRDWELQMDGGIYAGTPEEVIKKVQKKDSR